MDVWTGAELNCARTPGPGSESQAARGAVTCVSGASVIRFLGCLPRLFLYVILALSVVCPVPDSHVSPPRAAEGWILSPYLRQSMVMVKPRPRASRERTLFPLLFCLEKLTCKRRHRLCSGTQCGWLIEAFNYQGKLVRTPALGLYLGATGSSTEAFGARRGWVILGQADCTLWPEQEVGGRVSLGLSLRQGLRPRCLCKLLS